MKYKEDKEAGKNPNPPVLTHYHCSLFHPSSELLADMKHYGYAKRYEEELKKNCVEEEKHVKYLEVKATEDMESSKKDIEYEVNRFKSKRKHELKGDQEAAVMKKRIDNEMKTKNKKRKRDDKVDMGAEAKRQRLNFLLC